MNNDYWHRLLFKLRLYEASGESFQRLVWDVCQARFDDFRPIRPAGIHGDGGNDGYVPSQKWYLQVHGPMASAKGSPDAVARKLRDDFVKLRKNYPDIQRYSFVFNDRYEGVPRTLDDAARQLQSDSGVTCEILAARHLGQWFMELAEGSRASIVQAVPVEMPTEIDSRAVGEILRHLADHDIEWAPSKDAAPDFEDKIRFNGLAGPVAHLLRTYSYQTSVVDRLLETREPYLAQAIAHELRRLYAQSQERIAASDEDAAGVCYLWIREQLVPPAAQAHPHSRKAYLMAADVVLAKYFETCDVYAPPGSGDRAA